MGHYGNAGIQAGLANPAPLSSEFDNVARSARMNGTSIHISAPVTATCRRATRGMTMVKRKGLARAMTGLLVGISLAIFSTAGFAQSVVSTWIDLPTAAGQPIPGEPLPDLGNRKVADITILEHLVLFIDNGDAARIFYTTDGYNNTSNNDPLLWNFHAGTLRSVDIKVPIPDLFFTDGVAWPKFSGPDQNWHARDATAEWNEVLVGPNLPSNPFEAKLASYQSLISEGGVLFAAITHKSIRNVNTKTQGWNGLAIVDGTATEANAFNSPEDELWSSGPGSGEGVEAVPEGSEIATTLSQSDPGRFLFVTNYCGRDLAGTLLVQDISNLRSVDAADRVLPDLYRYLAKYIDTGPPAGPLGPEVQSSYFWTSDLTNPAPGCTVPNPPENRGGQ